MVVIYVISFTISLRFVEWITILNKSLNRLIRVGIFATNGPGRGLSAVYELFVGLLQPNMSKQMSYDIFVLKIAGVISMFCLMLTSKDH